MFAAVLSFFSFLAGGGLGQTTPDAGKEVVFEGKSFSAWVAILKDKKKDEFVRGVAARALGNFGTPAVGPLTDVLKDDSVILPCAAAETLGKMGVQAKTAVPALVGIVKDPKIEFHVRLWTIRALGAIGAEAKPAVPALLASLMDGESRIAIAAAQALGQDWPNRQQGSHPSAD
jgi:HEAT repeat protein